jgi:hypothetical protein
MIKRSARPTSHFVIISNSVIRDQRLSWKARGLLAYLLSMPDNWKVTRTHLASVSKDGITVVNSTIKELEDAGYMKTWRYKKPDGQFDQGSIVYDSPNPVDIPVDNPVDKPQNECDHTRFPVTENLTFKEVPIKEKLKEELVLSLSNREPLICNKCSGSSWQIIQGLDLEACDCDAGIYRVNA